jgi:hypothetical protein
MNSIEAYIQFKPGLITEYGQVRSDATAEFLRHDMTEFHGFIARVLTVLPRDKSAARLGGLPSEQGLFFRTSGPPSLSVNPARGTTHGNTEHAQRWHARRLPVLRA